MKKMVNMIIKNRIYIAGSTGMVGSSLYKELSKVVQYKVLKTNRKQLDLSNFNELSKYLIKNNIDTIINCAGLVGGIMYNRDAKSEFLYENTIINLNLIRLSDTLQMKKFINLGSSCIYPKNILSKIKEEDLLSDYLEDTNEGYALAKILALKYSHFLNSKNKNKYITMMPCNLYGENDTYDSIKSHVIPALILKMHNAKQKNLKKIELWGSGNVRREFLHIEDLVKGIKLLLVKKLDNSQLPNSSINIGTGTDVTIKELSLIIKDVVGYRGEINFNKKYPDGVKKKLLNSSRMKELGWSPKIKLKTGITRTYKEYMNTLNANTN